MLHSDKKSIRVIGILIFIAFVLATLLVAQVHPQPETLPTAANMSLLIKQLQEAEKPVLFQFTVPLVGDETIWNIPDEVENDEDEISRYISSVGDDYICFDELAGQAYSIRCTPFSNIVSISYLNQPN